MRLLNCVFLVCLCASAKQVNLTVLATTDMHGTLMPHDYFTAKPAPRGLVKIATMVREERKANPNTLLIDCGDTIQGSPLESYYHQRGKNLGPDPMMLAMNAMGYVAMALGNHEFNYGLEALQSARNTARFPWLSANTVAEGGARPFLPYVVKTVAGIKVAFVGITTPSIPSWEKPENYRGYRFLPGLESARKAVAELRAKERPDVIVVAAHSGIDRDARTGAMRQADLPGENMAYQIATEIPGIDAIFFGHTHQEVKELSVNGVVLVQPKNWAISLGKVELTLENKPEGGWRVTKKSGTTLPVTDAIQPDAEVLRIAEPYHKATEAWLNTTVTKSAVALDAVKSRIEDTAILDAIQQVQLHYAKADVSLCASFNTSARIPAGNVTVRQIAGLYVYDNELYAIEGTGRMLREALENAARFYNQCPDAGCTHGPLLNGGFLPFNFDMAQGVSYEVDLTRPVGQRIRNLQFRGKPLADDQPLRLAINNYRAGGSGGYSMFPKAKVVWRSYEDIRDLIIRYYSEGNPIPPKPDENWRVVPEAALRELQAETQAKTRQPALQ